MEFDSKEEFYISWWLDELKSREYIVEYSRAETYNLFKGEKKYLQFKIEPHVYTPDFDLKWTTEGWKIFNKVIPSLNDFRSILEVKPSFDAHNMTRLFRLNQKWVWQLHGEYVQLVTPETLFKKTFCPERFRLTDGGKVKRKLKAEYLTLDEYIQQYTDKQEDDRKGVQTNRKRKLQ